MSASPAGPPTVGLPGRLGRRLRLGPFESGHDALKFLGYGAAGAALVPLGLPWFAVPVIVGGLVVSLWKPDGEAIDRRLWIVASYARRRARRISSVTRRRRSRADERSSLRLPDGSWLLVVRTGGVPLAFSPPEDLAHHFETYRELLRAVDGEFYLLGTSERVFRPSLLPRPVPAGAADRGASDGYRELVDLLARRRGLRQVLVGLRLAGGDGDLRSRGDVAIDGIRTRLEAIGLRAETLRGRALTAAGARLGLVHRSRGS